MKVELTERDIEVLRALRSATNNHLKCGISGGWAQPMDCGGFNGSDHSYRLSKLASRGLAEQKQRGGWSRGSKSYRITEAGRQFLLDTGHREAYPVNAAQAERSDDVGSS